MINLYVSNHSLNNIDVISLENLFIELNDISTESSDLEKIFINDSIYSNTFNGNLSFWEFVQNFNNKQFLYSVFSNLLASLNNSTEEFISDNKIDAFFPDNLNGFYGFDFSNLLEISQQRQSRNNSEYKIFKFESNTIGQINAPLDVVSLLITFTPPAVVLLFML